MIDNVLPIKRRKETVSHRLRPVVRQALDKYASDRQVSRSAVIENALLNLPDMSTYIKKEQEAYAKKHKSIIVDIDNY